jgi:transposase
MKNTTKNSSGFDIRFNKAQRHQHEFRDICLDELVSEDHQVRSVWAYVDSLDLSRFYANYKAVEGEAGRKPADPRILLTIWLFATIEGITSGRRLAKLCKRDAVYMWICGHVGVNYNLLNDFRVQHIEALQDLMSQTIAILQHNGLIDFERISQDGVRVRAHAGKSSFRKKDTLEELLEKAAVEVERVLTSLDDDSSEQEKAAQVHAALDRQARIEEALRQYEGLAAQREKRKKGDGEKTRVSTTDPDARNMKMADGGFRPAYNVQAGTLNDSRIIVGLEVTNEGTDSGQMEPMLDQIESDFGERPKQILADGGYNSKEDVTAVEQSQTEVYSPVRKPRKSDNDPHERRRGDSDEVAAWRQRMKTEEAQEIYSERCSTAEFPFARFRNHGLYQFPVRGTMKVKAISLWHALVHNFQQMVTKNWLPAVTG